MPYLTSHHPECDYYRDDYLTINGVKLCVGCTFGYSTAIIILIIDFVTKFWRNISTISLFFLVSFSLLIELIYYSGLLKNKYFKIISKIFLGVLASIVILEILYSSLREPFKLILAFVAYGLINNTLTGIRLYRIEKTCRKCPMYNDFPLCNGFKEIIEKLERDGYVKLVCS